MKLLICLSILLIAVGCLKPDKTETSVPESSNISKTPSPSPPHVFEDEAHIGYMYWATPTPILVNQWQLVIGGMVIETHQEKIDYGFKDPKIFTAVTVKVEKIFLNLPTDHYIVSVNVKRFKSDLFDGLKSGDKVIVFAEEYDGGYGIVEVPDSNCKIGIKIKNWDEPIVGAIEKMINQTELSRSSNRTEMLKDKSYAAIWLPYSTRGIAYLLEEKEYW